MLAPNSSKNIQFQKLWLKPFFCCNLRGDAFSSRPRENSLKRLFSLRGRRNKLFVLYKHSNIYFSYPVWLLYDFLDELLYLQQQFGDK